MVAKVYEGDEGRHTYAAMTALWNSLLRFSSTVRIAEPLAFLPEINVALQELVPGTISLKDHLKQAFAAGVAPGVTALTELVRKSGRGLAELHTCGAAAGPDVTLDDQITAVRVAVTQLGDGRRQSSRRRVRKCSASGRRSWTACARASWPATRRSRRWTESGLLMGRRDQR